MRKILLTVSLLCALPFLRAQTPVYGPASGSVSLCHQTTVIPNTGNTTNNIIYTCTIPANMLGANSRVQVSAIYNATAGNSANCIVALRFGSAGTTGDAALVTDATVGATSGGQMNVSISNRNSTSAQIIYGFYVRQSVVGSTTSFSTNTVNVTNTSYITFSAQEAGASDTCSLQEADIVVWP